MSEFDLSNEMHVLNMRNAQVKRAYGVKYQFQNIAATNGRLLGFWVIGLPILGFILEELTENHYGILSNYTLGAFVAVAATWSLSRSLAF